MSKRTYGGMRKEAILAGLPSAIAHEEGSMARRMALVIRDLLARIAELEAVAEAFLDSSRWARDNAECGPLICMPKEDYDRIWKTLRTADYLDKTP